MDLIVTKENLKNKNAFSQKSHFKNTQCRDHSLQLTFLNSLFAIPPSL